MKKIFILLSLGALYLFGFEHLDSDNFEKEIKDKNVIVDFYATWCPPCKIMGQNLEEFSSVKPSDVFIYKVDVDQNMDLAKKYGVRSLPTIIFFKNGEPVAKEVGIMDANKLSSSIKSNFN